MVMSPGPKVTIGTSVGTVTLTTPSLCLSVRTGPSTRSTMLSTVALVIVLPAERSHG
jgi:hypothetical protein